MVPHSLRRLTKVCELLFFGVVGDADHDRRFKKAYNEGLDFQGVSMARASGEGLRAVDVHRSCPGDGTPGVDVTSKYNGLAGAHLGTFDEVHGGYGYYVPLIYASAAGFNTIPYIEHGGLLCSLVGSGSRPATTACARRSATSRRWPRARRIGWARTNAPARTSRAARGCGRREGGAAVHAVAFAGEVPTGSGFARAIGNAVYIGDVGSSVSQPFSFTIPAGTARWTPMFHNNSARTPAATDSRSRRTDRRPAVVIGDHGRRGGGLG